MRKIERDEQAFRDEWEIPLHCRPCDDYEYDNEGNIVGWRRCPGCDRCDSFDADELGIDPEDDYGDES